MFHLPNRKNFSKQLLSLVLTLAFLTSWVLLPSEQSVPSSPAGKAGSSTPAGQPGLEKGAANKPSVTTSTPSEPDPSTQKRVSEAYGKLPLSFEANQGQTDSEVKFISRGSGYNLYLTSTEAVLALRKPAKQKSRKSVLAGNQKEDQRASEQPADVLRMKLNGADPDAQVAGLEELPSKTNYFIGNDPEKWRTNIPNYARVQYREAYPGIDLVYYGNERQLEYDFVVAPGADPGVIKLAFEGARDVRVDARGDLVLKTTGGTVRWQKPMVYQEIDGIRREIDGRFAILPIRNPQSEIPNPKVGFQIAAYDRSKPLVIDPTLVYSTLVGGTGWDMAFGLAVGASGNAYITGWTASNDFPTVNPFQATRNSSSSGTVFVTKLNPLGTGIVYSTYLGSGQDGGTGIAVDSTGHAYVTGYTVGGSFPTTPGAFQATDPGPPNTNNFDAFITKLHPSGSELVYSTYLGGSDRAEANDIAVDASGNAYVTGYTWSSSFPTVNPVQPSRAQPFSPDAFVTKLNAAGSALVYSTHLGGTGNDEGLGIAVDSSGRAYVTGFTNATNFPTANAFQPTFAGVFENPFGPPGPGDVFVTRFSAAGSVLEYSTYLGGPDSESGYDIAVDNSGSAYVTGFTSFSGFPTTPGAFQSSNPGGGPNAFVTKFQPNGSALAYSTYLGGTNGTERGHSIAVDSFGNAYLTGVTASTNFPTLNAFQPTNASGAGGRGDAFVTKLNTAGSGLVYSTFLGGTNSENPPNAAFRFGLSHIALDGAGRAYVAGWTDSTDFPTSPDAFQRANRGGFDAFVTKLGAGAAGPGLSLERISPNRGGNSGATSVRVHGAGFASAMTIKLARAGQPDIIAERITVATDGDLATAVFDLRGGSPGLWDVVATNTDSTSASLRDAFTIEAGGKPVIWSDIVGRNLTLKGSPTTYTAVVGNRGNTDALGVILFIGGLPNDATVQPLFEIIPLPGNDLGIDFSQLSPYVVDHTEPNARSLPLFLPIVRAGQSMTFRVRISVPTSREYRLRVAALGPLFDLAPTGALAEASSYRYAGKALESSHPPGADPCHPANAACFNCLASLPFFGPGLGCAIGIANLARQAYCGDFANDPNDPTKGTNVFSASFAVLGTVLGCVSLGLGDDAIKALEKSLVKKIGDGLGTADACLGCAKQIGKLIGVASSFDPNDKVGSDGVGAEHYLTGEEPLRYMIFFENKPEATAPAHEVVITDQLSSHLDFATFEPGAVAFGNRQASLKADGNQFSTVVDLRPQKDLLVRISAALNPTTGLLTWRFTSIDPATGEMPDDPLAGFLPPNRTPPEGDGNVFFTIKPKAGLPTGTEIRNRASIIFDFNEAIDTPEWLNTIDNSKPASQVLPLAPQQSSPVFTVNWSGTDTGSGIFNYTIYLSTNGGPFTVWVKGVTTSTLVFYGRGSTSYAFYSVARDQSGNEENAKTVAEATTLTPPGNSIDDPQFFVHQHYVDFLNREPDAAGLAFWINQITECGSNQQCTEIRRINVSAAFYLSIEFQQTGYLVYRMYKAAYGNLPGAPVPIRFNEFPDTQQIGHGVVVGAPGWEQQLENNKNSFATDFVLRSRFFTGYPTTMSPASFVDALFTNAGVTPSAAERTAAINEFGSATTTSDTAARARVLRRVAENTTLSQQEFNQAFVLMQYFGYLRRNPNDLPDTDFAGYNFWLNKLNQFNGNFINAEMVKAFITSGEYRHRFGP